MNIKERYGITIERKEANFNNYANSNRFHRMEVVNGMENMRKRVEELRIQGEKVLHVFDGVGNDVAI